jgi:hypothetical protein
MRVFVSFCLCSLLFVVSAFAQTPTVTVAGTVVDATTRAPITTAVLTADGRQVVVETNGTFSIALTPGRKSIEVEAPGFFRLVTTIEVGAAGLKDAELALARDEGFAASVDVVAQSPAIAPATQAVAPIQVLRTPGALDNIFRTLQALPGVTATEEFGSRLAVRGGSPDQNLTVMDGVEVHDPYRLFGLTSAFNPETIQSFELATGGFSAKYGDRLSSLLAIENRDGTRDRRLGGSASLSITDVNVVTEGALPVGDGSWLFTARRTYLDFIVGRVIDQDFPGFGDFQGKVAWNVGQGKKLSVFALRSRQDAAITIDEDDARGEFQDDTANDLAWARFDWSIGTAAQSRTIAGYSNTESTFGVDATFEDSSRRSNTPEPDFGDQSIIFERALAVRDVSVRQEVSWSFGRHVIDAGAEVHQLETNLRFQIDGGRNPSAANGSSVQGGAGLPDLLSTTSRKTRAGAWVQDGWQIGSRASVQAGLRWDRAGNTNETLFSPRLATSLFLGPSRRIKAAFGRYTQSPGYEKLAQSDYLLDLGGDEAQGLVSEKAVQASVGFEQDIAGGFTLRAEGYYKRFQDLLVGRIETESERLARLAQYDFPASMARELPGDPIITAQPTNDGRGRGYGFDLFASRVQAPSDARINGWASYTWGRSDREAYGRRYSFEYDRRHAFAAVVSYRWSPKWEAATTTRVASGFPRTAPVGVRVAAVEDRDDRDRDGNVEELVPDLDRAGLPRYEINLGGVDNLYRASLPVFARVDLRVTWRPRGATSRWELYAEVINLLNRQNAGALEPRLVFDATSNQPRIVEEADQGIPRLPTIGVRFRF